MLNSISYNPTTYFCIPHCKIKLYSLNKVANTITCIPKIFFRFGIYFHIGDAKFQFICVSQVFFFLWKWLRFAWMIWKLTRTLISYIYWQTTDKMDLYKNRFISSVYFFQFQKTHMLSLHTQYCNDIVLMSWLYIIYPERIR